MPSSPSFVAIAVYLCCNWKSWTANVQRFTLPVAANNVRSPDNNTLLSLVVHHIYIYIYMGVVLRTHPVCGESHKSHISLADIWVLLIYQYRPKQHWLSVGVDKTLSYSSRMQTPCTIKYSKPRLIHIQFDWRFYPVWAKIRIKRRWLFLTWCHLSTDISVKIYGAPVVKILYLTDLAQKLLSLRIFRYLCAEIAISARI